MKTHPGRLPPPTLIAREREMDRGGRDIREAIEFQGALVHSFVTADKILCVYNAPDEATVREHAGLGGFPANTVTEVARMIDPLTADGAS